MRVSSTLSILVIVAYCTATPITPQALELSEAGKVPRGVADSLHESLQEREVSDISMLVARAATQDNSESKIQDLSIRANSHPFTIPGKNGQVKFTLGKLAVAVGVDGAGKVMMKIINDGLSLAKWLLNDLSQREVTSGQLHPHESYLINLEKYTPGDSMSLTLE